MRPPDCARYVRNTGQWQSLKLSLSPLAWVRVALEFCMRVKDDPDDLFIITADANGIDERPKTIDRFLSSVVKFGIPNSEFRIG